MQNNSQQIKYIIRCVLCLLSWKHVIPVVLAIFNVFYWVLCAVQIQAYI